MEQYEIQKEIGTGSFGQVFLAKHRKTNKTFVIKKIRIRGISAKDKENIETQIKLLRDLKHVNIVSYKDSFLDSEGVLNIVMQYCQEGDMHNKIRQGKKFDEQQVLDWTIQMCLAIYLMHQRRILHRDLKAQNIFLANGRIRLGDFGISKVLDSTVQLTSTVIGTPYYMSPELFNHRPYSYKTDIWALGCVIYEICSSRHAFDADNLQALARKVVNGSFAPIPSHYSKGLRQLVKKMLSVNPKDRPTVVQVLKSPVLRRRLQSYIAECLKEDPNQDNHLETLIQQAGKLGIDLKQPEIQQSHHESVSQPAHNPSLAESVQRSSSKQNKIIMARNESVQKLQKQRALSRDESRRQKNRIDEQNKKIQERRAIQKRNELLERQREKRRRMASQQRNRKHVSSQKKLSREESLPLLIETQSKRRIESSNISTTSRAQTKLPDISSHSGSYNMLPPPTVQTPKVISPAQITSQSSPPSLEVESKPCRKPFRMQEEYDMNFEEEEEEYQPVIEQKQEEEEEAEGNRLLTEYPQIFEESIPKKVEEETHKKAKQLAKQISKQTAKQQPKIRASEPIVKPQHTQHKKSQALQSKKSQLIEHRRSSMNPTRTQLEYSVSGSQWIPSRRELPTVKVEEKIANPKYIRLMDRISELRRRVELGITKQQYTDLYKLVKNQQKVDQQLMYSKALNIVDKKMIGMWHVVDKIVELEAVLEEIPALQ